MNSMEDIAKMAPDQEFNHCVIRGSADYWVRASDAERRVAELRHEMDLLRRGNIRMASDLELMTKKHHDVCMLLQDANRREWDLLWKLESPHLSRVERQMELMSRERAALGLADGGMYKAGTEIREQQGKTPPPHQNPPSDPLKSGSCDEPDSPRS
jgi:hypothetical protein